MNFYSLPDFQNHEQVSFFYEKESGLKAIVAIHSTTLGPALGGLRMWPYATDEEALVDVLRLSQGMTYKAAAAGLKLGGGKAVIIADPKKDKSDYLFRAFGKAVHSLGGRYITAEDVGTDVHDMETIRMETPFVTGVDRDHGGSGNPAPFTAYGTFMGLKAGVERKLGVTTTKGLTVAIQGMGNVGWELAKLLIDEGARIVATDIDDGRLEQAKAELGVHSVVKPNEIYSVDCDVFAPCALGAVINDETVEILKAKVIAGSSNNQLKEHRHGEILDKLGILYVPDYVLNAGGLINVYTELGVYSRTRSLRFCKKIYHNCNKVFDISERDGIPSFLAADRMAQERVEHFGRMKAHFNVYDREAFDKRKDI